MVAGRRSMLSLNGMKKYFSIMCGIVILAIPAFVAAQTVLTNPIACGETNINKIVGMILKGVLGLTGTISLIMFVYGGFQWLLSRGEPGEVKKGLDTMLWAGIGLIVIFGSYAILDRIFTIIPR